MHSTDDPRVSAALLSATREPTLTVPDERRPLRSRAALAAGFARTAGRGPRTAEDPTSGKSPERPASSPAASQMPDARDRRRHETRSCWRSASVDCFALPRGAAGESMRCLIAASGTRAGSAQAVPARSRPCWRSRQR